MPDLDYDKAVVESNALCKQLGDGWTPRVWENLGWHWSVERGPAEVYGQRMGNFTGCVRLGLAGSSEVSFWHSAPSAEEALGIVMQDAWTFVRRATELLRSVSGGDDA